MATDITGPHLWKLDTAEVVVTPPAKVFVRKVRFIPAVNSDDLEIQEYLGDNSTAKDAIILKGNGSNLNPVEIDFGSRGMALNGLKVSVIDGGVAHVYIRRIGNKLS